MLRRYHCLVRQCMLCDTQFTWCIHHHQPRRLQSRSNCLNEYRIRGNFRHISTCFQTISLSLSLCDFFSQYSSLSHTHTHTHTHTVTFVLSGTMPLPVSQTYSHGSGSWLFEDRFRVMDNLSVLGGRCRLLFVKHPSGNSHAIYFNEEQYYGTAE